MATGNSGPKTVHVAADGPALRDGENQLAIAEITSGARARLDTLARTTGAIEQWAFPAR